MVSAAVDWPGMFHAYGPAGDVPASLAALAGSQSFAARDEAITDTAYFGDLDANGLRVPAAASRLAEANGLPCIRPAVALYEALRTVGRPHADQPTIDEITAASLTNWLRPPHREWAAQLRGSPPPSSPGNAGAAAPTAPPRLLRFSP